MAVNKVYGMFAILFVKLSILLLYLRTSIQNQPLPLAVYVILVLLVSSHAATFPVYFATITPIDCQ